MERVCVRRESGCRECVERVCGESVYGVRERECVKGVCGASVWRECVCRESVERGCVCGEGVWRKCVVCEKEGRAGKSNAV